MTTNQPKIMKIRTTHTLYSPKTGREFTPSIPALETGWTASEALVAGLHLTDPGITRVIGRITGDWITAKGTSITAVMLVETSDWDGDEWTEWSAIADLDAVEAAGAKELRYVPVREAAMDRAVADYRQQQAAATSVAVKSGSDYRPQGDPLHPDKYDGLKAAREWAEDAYRSGDSWSDD